MVGPNDHVTLQPPDRRHDEASADVAGQLAGMMQQLLQADEAMRQTLDGRLASAAGHAEAAVAEARTGQADRAHQAAFNAHQLQKLIQKLDVGSAHVDALARPSAARPHAASTPASGNPGAGPAPITGPPAAVVAVVMRMCPQLVIAPRSRC